MRFPVEAANSFPKQRCSSACDMHKTPGFFFCRTKNFVLHNAYVIFFTLMVGEFFIRDKRSSSSVLGGREGAWVDTDMKGLETGKSKD